MGLPFVTSADLVSAYPAASVAVADYVDDLIPLLAMTQNAQTGVSYSFLLTDFTQLVTFNNASAVAVTLPLEATVAWPTSTQLRLLNIGAGTVTVAGAVGVTINGTPLTLAQYKAAILTKTGTNTWVFLPFSGGSAAAVVSSTTGSPTVTTDGDTTVYKFIGDGTIVIGTAGLVTLMACGAGGGAGQGPGDSGGGGGGGQLVSAAANLLAQTYTIKVPAGGAGGVGTTSGSTGFAASMRTVLQACGGGGGGMSSGATREGLSWFTGGGAGGFNPTAVNGGAANTFLDGLYAGGNASAVASYGAGGGAGNAGAGGNGSGSVGGTGGAGTASSATGASVTYGVGGVGGFNAIAGASGAANTGNGARGGTGTSNGGSGVFVVRVG